MWVWWRYSLPKLSDFRSIRLGSLIQKNAMVITLDSLGLSPSHLTFGTLPWFRFRIHKGSIANCQRLNRKSIGQIRKESSRVLLRELLAEVWLFGVLVKKDVLLETFRLGAFTSFQIVSCRYLLVNSVLLCGRRRRFPNCFSNNNACGSDLYWFLDCYVHVCSQELL